jgi:hypothetical protein
MTANHDGTLVADHSHVHGATCGHETRDEGGHIDYDHDGHWHHAHEGHWDEHDAATSPPPAPAPIADWSWLQQNVRSVALLGLAMVVFLLLVWFVVGITFPRLAPLDGESTVEETSAAVGAFLIFAGTVLTLVAFLPALILTILSSFELKSSAGPRALGGGLGGTIQAVISAIPDLLKVPAGFGVALVLLGVILMSSTALASENAQASPTPVPSSSGSAAPESAPSSPSPSS